MIFQQLLLTDYITQLNLHFELCLKWSMENLPTGWSNFYVFIVNSYVIIEIVLDNLKYYYCTMCLVK